MKMNVIYTVFVRIQTKEGTFAALVSDLDRIRALGTDAVCLTPIFRTVPEYQWDLQPNPYDVLDQREISGEYGSMEDFQNLVEEIHRRGMKCILEVVTASLSKASPLFKEHPEYFVYEKPEQGRFSMEKLLDRFHVTYDEFVAETNLTEEDFNGEWENDSVRTEMLPLDYGNPALRAYQVDTLLYWSRLVDGFRCVASYQTPLAFWKEAWAAVRREKPDFLWIGETCDCSQNAVFRWEGWGKKSDSDSPSAVSNAAGDSDLPPAVLDSASAADLFSTFDLVSDDALYPRFRYTLRGKIALSQYLDLLNLQETAYPTGYHMLRYWERLEHSRLASPVRERVMLENFTAFLYFLKGTVQLYVGQEWSWTYGPSLTWSGLLPKRRYDLGDLMHRLWEIRRDFLRDSDTFHAVGNDGNSIVCAERSDGGSRKIGVFSLEGKEAEVEVFVPDGKYTNLIDGTPVVVKDRKLSCDGRPVIITLPVQE